MVLSRKTRTRPLTPVGWPRRSFSLSVMICGWAMFFACQRPSGSPTDQTGGGSGAEATGGASYAWGGASGSGAQSSGGRSHGLRLSERGAGCVAQNDCTDGQSCVRGKCQPQHFSIEPTGKECFRIDCQSTEDCCKGAATDDIPQKCRSKAAKCSRELPGCSETSCDRSRDCGGGGVCVGACTVTNGECRGGADCIENLCDDGACTLDFAACSTNAECVANTCVGGQCACDNPAYEPADPICEDSECDDMCLFACEEDRCVIPSSCESNDDCFGTEALCDEGQCVECVSRNDCTFGKLCFAGRCETPCASDLHCPLFEACEAGQCIYVGCRSDRECSLLPSLVDIGLGELDQRLLRCATIEGIGRCILPCQSDGQCPPSEVCSGGICEYIGCETEAECKAILATAEVSLDEDTPWTTRLECRTPE